jgi:hypothetical protein
VLRLRPGANSDSFAFDLRPLYHATTAAVVLPAPDPCTLCFVHTASAAGYRVLRLRESEAGLVRSLEANDAAVDVCEVAALPEADEAGAVSQPEGQPASQLVSRLVRGGVLEWV